MTRTTAGDLLPWNDADEILRALGEATREQQAELRPAVEQLLSHAEADVRQEAARVLFVKW